MSGLVGGPRDIGLLDQTVMMLLMIFEKISKSVPRQALRCSALQDPENTERVCVNGIHTLTHGLLDFSFITWLVLPNTIPRNISLLELRYCVYKLAKLKKGN